MSLFDLFDQPVVDMTQPATIPVNHSVDPREQSRLSAQCARILERLQQGPASNYELAGIALKYTSRISDLREAGYQIDCVERDHETGKTMYRLVTR